MKIHTGRRVAKDYHRLVLVLRLVVGDDHVDDHVDDDGDNDGDNDNANDNDDDGDNNNDNDGDGDKTFCKLASSHCHCPAGS